MSTTRVDATTVCTWFTGNRGVCVRVSSATERRAADPEKALLLLCGGRVGMGVRLNSEGDVFDADAGTIEADVDLATVGVDQQTVAARPEGGDLNALNGLAVQGGERCSDGGGCLDRRCAGGCATEDASQRGFTVGAVKAPEPPTLQADLEHIAEMADQFILDLAFLDRLPQVLVASPSRRIVQCSREGRDFGHEQFLL